MRQSLPRILIPPTSQITVHLLFFVFVVVHSIRQWNRSDRPLVVGKPTAIPGVGSQVVFYSWSGMVATRSDPMGTFSSHCLCKPCPPRSWSVWFHSCFPPFWQAQFMCKTKSLFYALLRMVICLFPPWFMQTPQCHQFLCLKLRKRCIMVPDIMLLQHGLHWGRIKSSYIKTVYSILSPIFPVV